MINKGIVLFYFLFTVSDVFGNLTTPLPQNQAVLRGATQVTFSCTSTPYGWSAIGWSFIPVGQTDKKFIANGGNALDKINYDLSLVEERTSILVIKTVDESLAGTYICNEGAAFTASAQLIVYNSDPVCTSNASSLTYLTPGQVVEMSCSFNYSATSFPVVSANMTWSTSDSLCGPVSPNYSTSGILTTAVSRVCKMVTYSSFHAYQCQTSFRVNGSDATNVPSYKHTAEIPGMVVKYLNPNCSIEGAKSADSVYQGKSLSCKADANPSPNFRWSNSTNATLSTSSTVQIWNDGQYTCTAWNEVGSCQLSINLTTFTTTLPPTTTTPSTISSPTTTSLSVVPPSASGDTQSGGLSQDTKNIIIGVVVGVGGAILLAVLIAIICCCMKKKNKSADNYKEDRNAKRMNDYPPPYDGHVGPQRNSSPDVVDYSPPSVYRSSYGGSSPSQPKYVGDDNLNYAQIQVDNQPRSRQPLQVPQNSNYVEVALA